MRILLVIPSQYCLQHGRQDRSRAKIGRMANLSLPQVAALIPPEHEVEIVDDHFDEPDYNGDYDMVGLTCMTASAPRVYEIAAEFRQRGVPVVIGGYHATLATEDAEKHADAVVVGEAENVMAELLSDLQAGRLKRRYHSETQADLSILPVPRYDLLQSKGYRYLCWPVQATRGCPLICHFCSVTAFYKRTYRKRPPGHVADCIRQIPSNNILFVDDDLFIAGRSYLLGLFRELEPLGKSWMAQTDLKSVDNDEVLAAARRSGLRSVFMGMEAFHEETLAAIKKERTNKRQDYSRVLDKVHSHGVTITLSLIMGLDHDKPEHYGEIIDFLISHRVEEIYINMAIPLPGTPMGSDLEKSGQIRDRNWSHYDGTHELIAHPNYAPGQMAELYWSLKCQFYSLRSIFHRFIPLRRDGWRDHAALGLYNLLILRYWVRRRVSPYVANGFPWWMAYALIFRATVKERLFGSMDPTPLVGLESRRPQELEEAA